MAQKRLILLAACVISWLFFTPPAAADPSQTAVLADLVVNGPVDGDVVVFAADLVLGSNARVTGDAVAVGGNVRVAAGAEVGRHVLAVIGAAEVSPEAMVSGRVLSFSSLASLAQAPDAAPSSPRVGFAVRLLASGGWLLVGTGLAFLFPVRMRYAAWALPPLGLKVPALGLVVALTFTASLVVALGFGPALGVPMIAGLMVVFFAGKAVGLTVISCAVGTAVLRRWLHHPLPISLEVFVGMLVLLALRFLPIAGETLWSLLSVFALGASIAVIGTGPGEMATEPAQP
ncbi:MAG: polymer-forming cytoskeletal protein [Acidobacteriota bacterium]|nr:polymer-forming cytoskeletal protein [Acidobacteriota bacterium]